MVGAPDFSEEAATARAAIEHGVWYRRPTVTVQASTGRLEHTPWIMYLVNDTKLCKATTNHFNPAGGNYAYSRARFETGWGTTINGSDSGRCYGTAYSQAITPDNLANGGWTGAATTYCGDGK